MIVDTHAHVWSDDAGRYPWQPMLAHVPIRTLSATAEDLLREMDAAGISHTAPVQPSDMAVPTRTMVRGAARVVTDGGLRESPTIEKLDIPVYCAGRSAPTNLTRHHAVDGYEQTLFEDFVTERVKAGETIYGLYPPNQTSLDKFTAWKPSRTE